MENAVKALLIAAAVLIAILIISLGLVVYNKASETANNAGDLSEYEIQQHNERFKRYQSSSATGSEVNAMLTTVFNYNLTLDNADDAITVDGDAGASITGVLEQPPTRVSTNARYSITCNYTKGIVTSITVNKLTDGSNPNPEG